MQDYWEIEPVLILQNNIASYGIFDGDCLFCATENEDFRNFKTSFKVAFDMHLYIFPIAQISTFVKIKSTLYFRPLPQMLLSIHTPTVLNTVRVCKKLALLGYASIVTQMVLSLFGELVCHKIPYRL